MTTIGMLTLATFIVASFLFIVKHFVVDFLIQSYQKDNMGKFRRRGWFKPLSSHCLTHAGGTFIVTFLSLTIASVIVAPDGYVLNFTMLDGTDTNPIPFLGFYFGLSFFDYVTHMIIDRIKASPDLGGRYSIDQRAFWICLGLDQMTHAIVHFLIALGISAFMYNYGMLVPA